MLNSFSFPADSCNFVSNKARIACSHIYSAKEVDDLHINGDKKKLEAPVSLKVPFDLSYRDVNIKPSDVVEDFEISIEDYLDVKLRHSCLLEMIEESDNSSKTRETFPTISTPSSEATSIISFENETSSAGQTINRRSANITKSIVPSRCGSTQVEVIIGIGNKSIRHKKTMGSEGNDDPNPNSQIQTQPEDTNRCNDFQIEKVEIPPGCTKSKRCKEPSVPKLTRGGLYCDVVKRKRRPATMRRNEKHEQFEVSGPQRARDRIRTYTVKKNEAKRAEATMRRNEKHEQFEVSGPQRARDRIRTYAVKKNEAKRMEVIMRRNEKHEQFEVSGPQRARDRIRTYAVEKNEAKRAETTMRRKEKHYHFEVLGPQRARNRIRAYAVEKNEAKRAKPTMRQNEKHYHFEVLGPQRARDRIRTYAVEKNEAKRAEERRLLNNIELKMERYLEALKVKRNTRLTNLSLLKKLVTLKRPSSS